MPDVLSVAATLPQAYHPSSSLLSKQVLLALSPLHQQVLPPAEVAHYLPSSFMPAIGKALMQQLFDAPVLDGFEHETCRLQLWHVWWHVGLRRYAWLKQHQQQLQRLQRLERGQQQEAGSPSSPAVEELYMDADARWGHLLHHQSHADMV